jgi:cytochrome c oxidase subunit IV
MSGPTLAKTPKEEPTAAVEAQALAAQKQHRRAVYRQGLLVLAGLAVLTALEFWIATRGGGSTVFLFILILIKAGLIVQYYMHLDSVWGAEAEGGHG